MSCWLPVKHVLVQDRSSPPEVFFGKGVLKICNKFTREQPCRQLYWNRTSTWCSPVNLMHIFRTPYPKNTSEGLLRSSASKAPPTLHSCHVSVQKRSKFKPTDIFIWRLKGTLMQIWKSANIFVFIWKYLEDLTLKHLLLFEIWPRKTRESLSTNIQKQQNMLKISLLFKKFINFTDK